MLHEALDQYTESLFTRKKNGDFFLYGAAQPFLNLDTFIHSLHTAHSSPGHSASPEKRRHIGQAQQFKNDVHVRTPSTCAVCL